MERVKQHPKIKHNKIIKNTHNRMKYLNIRRTSLVKKKGNTKVS